MDGLKAAVSRLDEATVAVKAAIKRVHKAKAEEGTSAVVLRDANAAWDKARKRVEVLLPARPELVHLTLPDVAPPPFSPEDIQSSTAHVGQRYTKDEAPADAPADRIVS